jgi:Tubulin like
MADQGTIIPTMFIGLGGTGSRIVDRIASRAAKLPNWKSQLQPLTVFVSLDTNKLDQNQLSYIPLGNRILIGAFDKRTAVEGFRRSENVQALQWLDPGFEPRKGLKPGAGQIRVESRLGFFFHSPTIAQRLQQLVSDTLAPGITWRQSNPKNYNVYIYCTLAGGTGSGAFLSMAYLIHKVIGDTNEWQPRVVSNLLLSTLMTDVVGKDLHPDIHANTYAALKELEHMTKLNYKQERETGRSKEPFAFWNDENASKVSEVDSAPFFLSFIYDRPADFSLPSVEPVIADAAFLQVFTPNIANMASALDNYEKHLEELTRLPGEMRGVGKGYAKNYGAMGAAAMVLPANGLLDYCSLRFAAEAVRSQITFGVDPGDPADERARAMARLAVNYSDPKFLAMGDEGRDRVINLAFLESVRELARQDGIQELKDGYWYQLVESVDTGRATGTDDKGEVQHAESTLSLVRRKLEEQRRPLIQKVAIKERAFIFHKEGVSQYTELVSRLKEDIRAARVIVEQELAGLRRSAVEGEVVRELKLDPIAERFVVLRMLDECERKWIPDAQKQYEQAKQKDITDSKVNDRFEEEYKSLQDAAALRSMVPFRSRSEEFLVAREQAQEYYRSVAAGSRKLFDAEVQLGQFRELHAYLQRRSRQYARLARHMNKLVMDLEQSAEDLRRGQGSDPRFALSVEVFETLEQPRERIWDRVYRALYVDGGRYLSTFDRNILAQTISGQLNPKIREDGAVVEKTDTEMVDDLHSALLKLGVDRMRPTIFGSGSDQGLDLNRGLELEARLMLAQDMADPTPSNIKWYMGRKFRALSQISGVLARVRTGEWRAFDDGVLVDRTRYLTHGFGDGTRGQNVPTGFLEQLKSVLEEDGKSVNIGHWHDPRLAIVYDVELPIPLYYIAPVTEEIEKAYLMKTSEKRSYSLHTDKRWEEALPNLNPSAAELSMTWAIRTLAKGLVADVVQTAGGNWQWIPEGGSAPQPLGNMLATALYELGELRRDEDAARVLERAIENRVAALSPDDLKSRREKWRGAIENAIGDIALRQRRAEATPKDVLDRPILRVLQRVLEKDIQAATSASRTEYQL